MPIFDFNKRSYQPKRASNRPYQPKRARVPSEFRQEKADVTDKPVKSTRYISLPPEIAEPPERTLMKETTQEIQRPQRLQKTKIDTMPPKRAKRVTPGPARGPSYKQRKPQSQPQVDMSTIDITPQPRRARVNTKPVRGTKRNTRPVNAAGFRNIMFAAIGLLILGVPLSVFLWFQSQDNMQEAQRPATAVTTAALDENEGEGEYNDTAQDMASISGVIESTTAIQVNGQAIAILSSGTEAEAVLEQFKQSFLQGNPEDYVDIAFVEDISLIGVDVHEEEVSSFDGALQLLASSGVVTVRTVEELTRTERIPIELELLENPDENSDFFEVIQIGADGEQEVVARITRINGIQEEGPEEIISTRIIRDMEPQILVMGTMDAMID